MKKTKVAAKDLVRQIAKSNTHVDERIVLQSIEYVNFAKRLGGKSGRFGILRSSESSLKIKSPALHMMN